MRKLKLACDIDGCVCSLSDAILSFAAKNGIKVDTGHYPWLGEEVFRDNPEIFLEGREVKGAPEALGRLAGGYEVVFLSSRPKEAKTQTEAWLRAHGMAYPVVFLTGAKGDYAKEHDFDLAIEDSPEHILSYERCGIPVFRCRQPYNEAMSTPEMIW